MRLQGDGITLRDLTVVNDDSGGAGNFFFAVAIGTGGVVTQDWRITNVTAQAMGGSISSIGVFARPVNCDGGKMTNVTASAGGAAAFNVGIQIECTDGSITGSNLKATASDSGARGLTKFRDSTLTMHGSSFTGATNSVSRVGGTLKVISSELDGPVNGTVICVYDYDGAGAALENGTNGSGGCVLTTI